MDLTSRCTTNVHYRGRSAHNPQMGVILPVVTKSVHRFVTHAQDASSDTSLLPNYSVGKSDSVHLGSLDKLTQRRRRTKGTSSTLLHDGIGVILESCCLTTITCGLKRCLAR